MKLKLKIRESSSPQISFMMNTEHPYLVSMPRACSKVNAETENFYTLGRLKQISKKMKITFP